MMKYEFTEEELAEIGEVRSRYPEAKAATLPVLWIAQKKFGHVKPEVQRLVAATLGLPESHVHGVAEFYTQYYKEERGKVVLDVCTCFTCQVCGGYEVLQRLEEKLGIRAGETTEDGLFTLQEVECLGACGYAPVMQVNSGAYVNHLSPEKADQVVEEIKEGRMPEFEPMKMRKPKPQEN